MRGLQQKLKLSRIATLDEEAVGILSVGQGDASSDHTLCPEAARQPLRRLLAACVGVGIEG